MVLERNLHWLLKNANLSSLRTIAQWTARSGAMYVFSILSRDIFENTYMAPLRAVHHDMLHWSLNSRDATDSEVWSNFKSEN